MPKPTNLPSSAVTAAPVPPGRLALLGLQHVLVMYAGAVAVPLIVGRSLSLDLKDVGLLISADLFAAGLATLIQTIGFRGLGIRLPIMMGVTFASVAPMLAIIGAAPSGLPAEATLGVIYGAVICAGLFGLLVAPVMGRLARLFPALVSGTIILVIGISLLRIGIEWAAGARPDAPDFGAPAHLAMTGLTLVIVLALMRYGRGLLRNCAVLIGIAAGSLVAAATGQADFSRIAGAAWFAPVLPFAFALPRFDPAAALSMCLVMIVVMTESLGMFYAVSRIVDRPIDAGDVARGLRADALGTLIGGVFNTFPYTSFSQNVGLLAVTGVTSRYVCAAGGVIMLLLGLCPKLAMAAAAVPTVVLGGAGLVMFGMIAATGVRMLATVDFAANQNNLIVVAVATSLGTIPLVADKFFQFAPAVLAPLLHSGILLATVAAVILNLFFNGLSAGAAVED